MGFRDRFFTPTTAKAILSWRILLGAVVGVAAGLLGVPVVGYRTDCFPAFYVRDHWLGLPVPTRVDSPRDADLLPWAEGDDDGPRAAVGRVMVYDDTDADGRRDDGEDFIGASRPYALVYNDETLPAGSGASRIDVEPGLHVTLLPLACGALPPPPPPPPPGSERSCDVPLLASCHSNADCGADGDAGASYPSTFGKRRRRAMESMSAAMGEEGIGVSIVVGADRTRVPGPSESSMARRKSSANSRAVW